MTWLGRLPGAAICLPYYYGDVTMYRPCSGNEKSSPLLIINSWFSRFWWEKAYHEGAKRHDFTGLFPWGPLCWKRIIPLKTVEPELINATHQISEDRHQVFLLKKRIVDAVLAEARIDENREIHIKFRRRSESKIKRLEFRSISKRILHLIGITVLL